MGLSDSHASLDDMPMEQLSVLLEEMTDWLVTKADDLSKYAGEEKEWRREAQEVAALGRLVAGLRHGWLPRPDPVARELVARSTTETGRLGELESEYHRELSKHEAWVALLGRFDDCGPPSSETA